jgi:hypothetical protein
MICKMEVVIVYLKIVSNFYSLKFSNEGTEEDLRIANLSQDSNYVSSKHRYTVVLLNRNMIKLKTKVKVLNIF